jgi:hypothetical protein
MQLITDLANKNFDSSINNTFFYKYSSINNK